MHLQAITVSHCHICYSGIEALSVLQSQSFDVIITDKNMPEMDGLTLAKEVNHKYPENDCNPSKRIPRFRGIDQRH